MAGTGRFPLPHDEMKVDLAHPVPRSREVEAFRAGDLYEVQNPAIELLGPLEIGHIDLNVIDPSVLKRIHPVHL
jgi:hypothetical protein